MLQLPTPLSSTAFKNKCRKSAHRSDEAPESIGVKVKPWITYNCKYLYGECRLHFFPLFKVQLNDETEIKVPPFEAP